MINKIVLLSAILFTGCLTNVFCQNENQGKVIIGAQSFLDFSYDNSSAADNLNSMALSKSIAINFAPQVGYFVTNSIITGVKMPINYAYYLDKQQNNQESSTSILLNPFVKSYLGNSYIKPYLMGGAGIGIMKLVDFPAIGYADEYTMGLTNLELGLGVGFFLEKNVVLDIEMGYNTTSVKPREDNPDDFKFLSKGLYGNLGINIILQ